MYNFHTEQLSLIERKILLYEWIHFVVFFNKILLIQCEIKSLVPSQAESQDKKKFPINLL